MATYLPYYNWIENLCNKIIDCFGPTDTWKAVIHTDAGVQSTDVSLSDLTEIGNSNGYITGGKDILFNSTRTSGIVTATASDQIWTAIGGNLGSSTTGRYFSIYDDTPTSPADVLLCSYDYGATFTVASGETMTLDFGASLFTIGLN